MENVELEKLGSSKEQKMSPESESPLKSVSLLEEGKATTNVADDDIPEGSAGLTNSIFNLTNAAIGSGMLNLPSNLNNMGSVVFTLFALFVAFLSAATTFFMGKAMIPAKAKTYTDLARASYGSKGELFTLCVFLFLLFAPLTIYHIVVGGYVANVIGVVINDPKSIAADKNLIAFLFGLVITFPLCLIKDMAKLAKFSGFCLLAIVYFVILVVVEFGIQTAQGKLQALPAFSSKPVKFALAACGNILLSYCNHTSAIEIFRSLRKPTVSRQVIVNGVSNGVTLILYLIVAFAGFLVYGTNVPDNVLIPKESEMVNFPHIKTNAPHYLVGRVLFAVMIALSYPFLVVPGRYCIDFILNKIGTCYSPRFLAFYQGLNELTVRIVLTLFLIFVPYLITLTGASLGVVAGFFGASAGSLVIFTLPCLFFLQLAKDGSLKISPFEKYFAYFIIVVSIVFFFVGSVSVFL